MSDFNYKHLLRDALRNQSDKGESPRNQRKKRRIRNEVSPVDVEVASEEKMKDDKEESDYNSEEFEDVSLDNISSNEASFGNTAPEETTSAQDEILNVVVHNTEEKDTSKIKKITTISKDEREQRLLMHRICISLMIIHGALRNYWCNDYRLQMKLRQHVSPHVMDLILQANSPGFSPNVKSRKFLDGLRMLLIEYSNKFKVRAQGIVYKNWNELRIEQHSRLRNVDAKRFRDLIIKMKGSRDLGAQGFVCLLRSLGLEARLVFSLQVPDFTNISKLPHHVVSSEQSSQKDVREGVDNKRLTKKHDQKAKYLSSVRESGSPSDKLRPHYFENSMYPVFWIEVWNKFAEKWVSIDPMVMKTMEMVPIRKKSKFEPPGSDLRNKLTYVIAYDSLGGVKDITRRYSEFFNAKTVKKRIPFKSDADALWYNSILKACSSLLRKTKHTKLDILEAKEFNDRDLAEGFPNSMADFKNHPLYALESQLKQTEIIYPKDSSSLCGYFRQKNKGSLSKSEVSIPIYKRSSVHILKSQKGWFHVGRVLKPGVQPLKTRKHKKMGGMDFDEASDSNDYGDDDNEMVHLYADFQTKLYMPPPIVDGNIQKNTFGNVEIFTPTMVPENGYLIDTRHSAYSLKLAQTAAKIIGIDFATAIVSFDFGRGRNKSHKLSAQAKEGGILIDNQYKEAMILVMDNLVEEEIESRRKAQEYNALRAWKLFLLKLKIYERLNKEHGELDKFDETSKNSPENTHYKNLSASESHSENSDNSELMEQQGGFFVDSALSEEVDIRPFHLDAVSSKQIDLRSNENFDNNGQKSMVSGFNSDEALYNTEGNSATDELRKVSQEPSGEVASKPKSMMSAFNSDEPIYDPKENNIFDELYEVSGVSFGKSRTDISTLAMNEDKEVYLKENDGSYSASVSSNPSLEEVDITSLHRKEQPSQTCPTYLPSSDPDSTEELEHKYSDKRDYIDEADEDYDFEYDSE